MAKKRTTGTDLQQPKAAGQANVPAVYVESDEETNATKFHEELTMIAGRLGTLADEQVTAKVEIEQRWLKDVRAFHGIYDHQTEGRLKLSGGSRAFVKATRAKTVALEARLFDMIFPTDDRNWGIQATPVPKLSKEAKEATLRATKAAEQATDAEAAGNTQEAAELVAAGNDQAERAKAANAEILKANESSEAMQEEMDDQLTEAQYPSKSRDMIHDACLLGTGILKGPVVNGATRGRWLPVEREDGSYSDEYMLEQRADPRPSVSRVDPWAFFPDMSASKIEEAEFTFERYLWTKKDLRKMVRTHGFDQNAVRELLRDEDRKSRRGESGLHYLTQLRSLTGETDGTITGRFVGWEYHGALEQGEVTTILRALGRSEEAEQIELEDDPLREFRVVVHFCDGKILKIAEEYPLDSGETLYSVFNIEEAEGSIFGYGVPHIMSDSQIALNSSWRMAQDNSGLSVGPQAMIDKDSIQPADGDWTMKPKKVWLRTKAAAPNAPDPIQFFNVPNNMDEISAIIRIALEFIDMETGMPMPQQGEQGANTTQTVGGMTILQNSANVIFRRIVKNYDDGIIAPTMRRFYDWNMQFNPETKIKGDMQIDARGTAVLLMKELQSQNLMLIVTQLMSHPAIQPMLKPYKNVQKLFQSMMIAPDETMVTEDEYKENMAKLAEQPPAPDPAEINARSRVEAAQIQADAWRERNQTQLAVAELTQQTQMMELAQAQGLSLEKLSNELQKLDKTLESQERRDAVKIAVENQRAEKAEAAGRDPTDATGQGIG